MGLWSATDDDLLLTALQGRLRAAGIEIHDLSGEAPTRSGVFHPVGAQLQAAALAELFGINTAFMSEAPGPGFFITLGPADAAEMLASLDPAASCP